MTRGLGIYGETMAAIQGPLDLIGGWLDAWVPRRQPDTNARLAAGDALAGIDATITNLHTIRAQLLKGDPRDGRVALIL